VSRKEELRKSSSTGGRRQSDAQLRTEFLRLKGSVYDPNTDLQTSAAVIEAVRALFTRGRTVGLLHLEIDPLTRVEAVYGWQVLDRILKSVAGELRWLRQNLLPPETVISQYGIYADRFLLFLPLARTDPGADTGLLSRASRSLHEQLTRIFGGNDFRGMSPRPAFSIGSTTIVEHPFYRLERQLYRAIDEARLTGVREETQERGRQHAELKRIIRDKRIEILFQPVLHLESERIIGYEAFTRGPRDSMFEMPSMLFECSREMGMEGELDLLCQRTALKQARRLAAGDVLFLNALPASLLDPGYREGLLAELPEDYPIARKDIVLEIADKSSIVDYDAFGSEVTDLRARGFRVSIDDVGKGTSSLESLSAVHPDFIKIDGSLVRNIQNNLIKQELLRSLCRVARQMEAAVIAVGIETLEELATVKLCGADYGQGFLFFRPSREIPARRMETGQADA
jgi:EAL domain-containing protein (putative c-di-GMP-specific phosphodiesterase class I)/GGDEF domain-containing protein